VSWWDYVMRVSGNASQNAIGNKTGLSQSAVNRWQSSSPKPETIVLFARTYGRPVLEAFVAAGLLSEDDARLNRVTADLTEVETDKLVAELARRFPGDD
jgi:transcriptional regulator with XRE-family HTH domain